MVKVVNEKVYKNEEKKTVIVFLFDEFGHKFKGQSWCMEEDTFDEKLGYEIALLKAQKKMYKFFKKEYEKTLAYNESSWINFATRCNKEIDIYTKALDYTQDQLEALYDTID